MRPRPSLSTTASTESSHSRVSTGSVSAFVLMPPVLRKRATRVPIGRLHDSLVRVSEVAEPGLAVARGAQEPGPRHALVRDGPELPHAERGPVRPVERPGVELRVVRPVLGPDRLPQLVVVLPRRDKQEVEGLAAAMQDHESELAAEPELAESR